jgi:multidrug efflux pump subunit AcrB
LLKQNGSTLAGFTIAVAMSVAVYNGGWLVRTFMPIVPSDFIQAKITMPEGSSAQQMRATLIQVEEAAEALKQDETLKGDTNIIRDLQSWSYGNTVEVALSLEGGAHRTLSANDIAERWRSLIGPISNAEEIKLNATINDISEDIRLRLSVGTGDAAALQRATDAVIKELSRYPGVYDVRNSLTAERTEIELDLKPHAETLGLSLQDIARQIRQGFYGEEVQRIPRGREDVKVMVRYSQAERTQIEHLSDMRIRTSDGREIPLEAVADIAFVPGYTKIERVDRKRAIIISAEVEEGVSDPTFLIADLKQRNTAAWKQAFPGFDLAVDGDMGDEAEFLASALRHFMLAMLIVYGLMAVAFRSYWQPLLVLTAIPFGFMGAVIGHVIMGREVSMMSMLGFFACAGVVVNDNLVLLDRINQLRKQGLEVFEAVMQAGRDRFRPIVLTSLTTFIGLMPIMAETSTQALFLIPMVISLSFGVLFATTVTLILVPAMYLSAEQLRTALSKKRDSWMSKETQQ